MQNIQRNAFTMIELVFVIVVLGILSAIAVPKLAATRGDAEIAKIRSDVSSIRSAIISERQGRLLKGDTSYISSLDAGVSSNTDGVALFDTNGSSTLLTYPIYTKKESNNKPTSGHWLKINTNSYRVNANGTFVDFNYTSADGKFDCGTGSDCISLLN